MPSGLCMPTSAKQLTQLDEHGFSVFVLFTISINIYISSFLVPGSFAFFHSVCTIRFHNPFEIQFWF